MLSTQPRISDSFPSADTIIMQFTSALTALTTVLALVATPVFAVDAVVKVLSDVSCNAETARWRPDCSGQCHRFNTDNFNSLSTLICITL